MNLLFLQAEGVGIAKNQRPLFIAVEQLTHDDLLIIHCLKKFIILHFFYFFLKIAKNYLVKVHPSFFQQTVHEESDRVYIHITHHKFIGPLVNDSLEIYVVMKNLIIEMITSFSYDFPKNYLIKSIIFLICIWNSFLVRFPN